MSISDEAANELRYEPGPVQVTLPLGINTQDMPVVKQRNLANPSLNRLSPEDKAFHDWYRFVLSFPAHIVRDYARDRFRLGPRAVLLDPFCGTGTTLVEAKRLGLSAVGLEAHRMAWFASRVKTDWSGDPDTIESISTEVAQRARKAISCARRLRTLADVEAELLLTDSISDVPLHKVLLLREKIVERCEGIYRDYALLCLAKCAVETASNLHFGPEVGVRGRRADAEVVGAWLHAMRRISADLRLVHALPRGGRAVVHYGDARNPGSALEARSIDAVFTSPPYPNEKDYTRTTRLESVLLGFLSDKSSLRAMKSTLLRSNTRNIYKGDSDDLLVEKFSSIQTIAAEIEKRRISLGKTSGFEKLYSKVTRQYFGGMARHFEQLRAHLTPGAALGYVVGDQASFFRVHIPTAKLLVEIAESLGYRHLGTDVFRTRISTATKAQLEEHVLMLRWEG